MGVNGDKILAEYKDILLPLWEKDAARAPESEYIRGYYEAMVDLVADIEDGTYDD